MILHQHSYRYRTDLGLSLGSQQPHAARYPGSLEEFIDLQRQICSQLLRCTLLRVADPPLCPKRDLTLRYWASEKGRRRKPMLILIPWVALGHCFRCRGALRDSDRQALSLETVVRTMVLS